MTKKNLILAFIGIVTLMACHNENSESIKDDSLFQSVSTFPEIEINSIDSLYLENLESKYQDLPDLNSTTVNELFSGYNQPETEINQCDFVDELLKIDTLKSIGGYENYTQNLDIGMLRDAKGFKVGQFSLNENKSGAIWGIWYSSYEACPYFHGVDVYLSVFDNSQLQKTYKIGSSFSSVDPPVAVYNPISSTLNGSELQIKIESNEIDLMDDGKEEIVRNQTQLNNYQL